MTKVARKRITAPRIVQPGTGRSPLLIGLVALLLLALGWQAFEYGRYQAGYDKAAESHQQEMLMERIRQQEELVSGLRLEVARYRSEAQIEGDAARTVQDDLVAMQAERAELKKEVEFLRGLVAESSGPLYIRDFRLEAGEGERQFRYQLTVAQLLENVKATRGSLKLLVSGKMDDQDKQLKMAEVDQEERSSVALKFRHFQDVAGVMLLPAGFQPETLTIEISPKSKKLKQLTRVFDWAVASGEETADGT